MSRRFASRDASPNRRPSVTRSPVSETFVIAGRLRKPIAQPTYASISILIVSYGEQRRPGTLGRPMDSRDLLADNYGERYRDRRGNNGGVKNRSASRRNWKKENERVPSPSAAFLVCRRRRRNVELVKNEGILRAHVGLDFQSIMYSVLIRSAALAAAAVP